MINASKTLNSNRSLLSKEMIRESLGLKGFEDWVPSFQSTDHNRPKNRPIEKEGVGRIGAVLLILFPSQKSDSLKKRSAFGEGIQLVLTKRRHDLNHHPGQISFPGGRVEIDESLNDAALRETHEEIGIEPESLELLGSLRSIYIPPSDFTVFPFVAWHDDLPTFRAEPSEVAEVLTPPISHFFDESSLVQKPFESDGETRNLHYYEMDQHKVWGATAIILTELLDRIKTLRN